MSSRPDHDDLGLPPLPGTAPIPEGHVRLFHQTQADHLEGIRAEGIHIRHARGIEGPKAIYADEGGFYGKPGDVPTVEFHVPKDHWSRPFVRTPHVTPDQIVAIHEPWHSSVRYIHANVLDEALAGQFDHLKGHGDKYTAALDHIQARYGKPALAKSQATFRTLDAHWGDDDPAGDGEHRLSVEVMHPNGEQGAVVHLQRYPHYPEGHFRVSDIEPVDETRSIDGKVYSRNFANRLGPSVMRQAARYLRETHGVTHITGHRVTGARFPGHGEDGAEEGRQVGAALTKAATALAKGFERNDDYRPPRSLRLVAHPAETRSLLGGKIARAIQRYDIYDSLAEDTTRPIGQVSVNKQTRVSDGHVSHTARFNGDYQRDQGLGVQGLKSVARMVAKIHPELREFAFGRQKAGIRQAVNATERVPVLPGMTSEMRAERAAGNSKAVLQTARAAEEAVAARGISPYQQKTHPNPFAPPLRKSQGPDHPFLYHTTELDNLDDIRREGLTPRRPSYRGEQRAWPTGTGKRATEGRVYFGPSERHIESFQASHRQATLRVRREALGQPTHEESGDLFVRQGIKPSLIEHKVGDTWQPLAKARAKRRGADERGHQIEHVASYYETPGARDLAHLVKTGDPDAITQMGHEMAPHVGPGVTLIPVPGRNGEAHVTLRLAHVIAAKSGATVANVLRGTPRESLYHLKKTGQGLPDLGLTLSRPITGPHIAIDNVAATGHTARAVRALLPEARFLVHSIDHTAGHDPVIAKSLDGHDPIVAPAIRLHTGHVITAPRYPVDDPRHDPTPIHGDAAIHAMQIGHNKNHVTAALLRPDGTGFVTRSGKFIARRDAIPHAFAHDQVHANPMHIARLRQQYAAGKEDVSLDSGDLVFKSLHIEELEHEPDRSIRLKVTRHDNPDVHVHVALSHDDEAHMDGHWRVDNITPNAEGAPATRSYMSQTNQFGATHVRALAHHLLQHYGVQSVEGRRVTGARAEAQKDNRETTVLLDKDAPLANGPIRKSLEGEAPAPRRIVLGRRTAPPLTPEWHTEDTREHPMNPRKRVVTRDGALGTYELSEDPMREKHVRVSEIQAVTRGGGRAAMEHLTERADRHGVTLSLSADPLKPTGEGKQLSARALKRWYTSHGFASPPGSKTGMVRRPER